MFQGALLERTGDRGLLGAFLQVMRRESPHAVYAVPCHLQPPFEL